VEGVPTRWEWRECPRPCKLQHVQVVPLTYPKPCMYIFMWQDSLVRYSVRAALLPLSYIAAAYACTLPRRQRRQPQFVRHKLALTEEHVTFEWRSCWRSNIPTREPCRGSCTASTQVLRDISAVHRDYLRVATYM
jgi:hypothetical protein